MLNITGQDAKNFMKRIDSLLESTENSIDIIVQCDDVKYAVFMNLSSIQIQELE